MSTQNGKPYSDTRGLNLRGSALGTGLLRWAPPVYGSTASNWASNPFSTDDYGLYVNTSGSLVFSSLGATTILGAAGGGGAVPTWEQIFANDKTLNVAGTTFTIDDSTAGSNNVLTLTGTGAGSGNLLQITNTGTGKDINGTSSTWSVTKTGVAVFLSAQVTTNVIGSSGLTLSASGAGVVTIGANTNTVTVAKAATFSSTITVTDGLTDLISTSNSADALRVTNNTATTLGAGVGDLGVAVVRSTSLTTGTLLQLQLTESALTTGNYLTCWDVTGSAVVFEIGKAGAVTQGGVGGSTVYTITAGDMVMSDGSLAITDADNAATFSVTNNTATTNSVIVLAGSGVFTGTTTTSWMTLTPSGLTTGTALYIAAAGATTSVGVVDIAVAGLTSGSALRITGATANFTTGGKLIELTSTAAVAGNLLTATTTGAYSGTGMVLITAGAMTTGITLSIVSTTGLTSGSLIRATSSTAGTIATNGAISFTATGNFTVGAISVGYVSVQAASTAAGTIMSVTGGALTTGIALYLADTSTGMTSGSLIRATVGTTGAVATSGVYSFLGTGAFTTGASTVGMFHVAGAATVSGTIMSILGGAQTTGIALNITDPSTGMTSGSLLRVITATTGAVATNGIISLQSSGAFTSTTIGFVNVIVSGAVAGTGMAVQMSAASQTTGIGFRVDQSNTTTGYTGDVVRFTGSSTTGQANTLSVVGVHTTLGNVVSITNASSSQTGAVLLNVAQSGTTTGFTGSVVSFTGSSTTGSGNTLLVTGVNTTTGDTVKVVSNALVAGTSTAMFISHTTSVLGAGNSLLRITSTGVDTGTTTGTLLDLNTTACVGSTAVMLTDSSNDTAARVGLFSKVTNAAAVLAVPFKTSNVAVTGTGSKFTKHFAMTDGTKTCNIWLSQDNTSPNGNLTGLKGDICLNGTGGATFYCSADGTSWSTMG